MKRLFCVYGWVLVLIAALGFSWLLTGCDDLQAAAQVAQDLSDAQAQARREWLQQFAEVKP